jgi:hypothetical protein
MEIEAAENLLLGLDKTGVLQKERIADD